MFRQSIFTKLENQQTQEKAQNFKINWDANIQISGMISRLLHELMRLEQVLMFYVN